jgi:hypothetical protein
MQAAGHKNENPLACVPALPKDFCDKQKKTNILLDAMHALGAAQARFLDLRQQPLRQAVCGNPKSRG